MAENLIAKDTREKQRKNILAAARRHPQSMASKLIFKFEEKPDLNTLVMVVDQIADSAEYADDPQISLSYYLNYLWEFICTQNQFLKAGAYAVYNSTRIYEKRCDSLYERVTDITIRFQEAEANDKTLAVTKVRVKRKRNDEAINPYTVEMEVKKFKTLATEKRLGDQKEAWRPNSDTPAYLNDEHQNTALWKSTLLIDANNPNDSEPLRNFKLYTSHFDHMSYMPIDDFNFPIHYLVGDFLKNANIDDELQAIDVETAEIEKRSLNIWAHQDYLKKMLHYEKRIFSMDESQVNEQLNFSDINFDDSNVMESTRLNRLSAIGMNSTQETGFDISEENSITQKTATNASITIDDHFKDSGMCLDETLDNNAGNMSPSMGDLPSPEMPRSSSDMETVQNGVNLPAFYDEGIDLSDLEDNTRRLSPVGAVEDIMPDVPDEIELNENVDSVKTVAGSSENETNINIKIEIKPPRHEIKINLLKINEKILRRRLLFKLGPELNNFKKQRLLKRKRADVEEPIKKIRQTVLNPALKWTQDHQYRASPTHSLINEMESFGAFNGWDVEVPIDNVYFDDDHILEAIEQHQRLHRDSRDSGCSLLDFTSPGTPLALSQSEELDASDFLGTNECDLVSLTDAQAIEETATDQIRETELMEETGQTELTGQTEMIRQHIDVQTNNEIQSDDQVGIEPDNSQVLENLNSDEMQENSGNQIQFDQENTIMDNVNFDDDDDDEDDTNGICNDTLKKTREFFREMGPSIEESWARATFSVQDIGTTIIDKLANSESQQLSVAQLMHDENPRDLCRQFYSLLFLTNHNNVELNANRGEVNSPEDITAKLLSTERHKVSFEDDIGSTRQANNQIDELSAVHPTPDNLVKQHKAASLQSKLTDQNKLVKLREKKQKQKEQQNDEVQAQVNNINVRFVQSIPKIPNVDDANDSGFSSMVSNTCESSQSER